MGDRVDALRARLAAATQTPDYRVNDGHLPWHAGGHMVWDASGDSLVALDRDGRMYMEDHVRDLIAHAPADLAALLAVYEALVRARPHVEASATASHLFDGFGPIVDGVPTPPHQYASDADLLLADIDTALAACEGEEATTDG